MRIVAALLLVAVGISILSGSSEPSNATTVDPDPSLTRGLEADRRAAGLPGMAVAVIRRGSVVYSHGFGLADVESDRPVTVNTPFHVDTVGSVLCAMTALVLAEDGVVDLDRDVNAWLDLGFPVEHPQHPSRDISLRALLSHHAAILDHYDAGQAYLFAPPGSAGSLYVTGDSPIGSREFLVRRFSPAGDLHAADGTWGPLFAPGEAYRASSYGIAVAAYALGRASAMAGQAGSYEAEVRRRILDPLSMTHSGFRLAHVGAQLAKPYDVWSDGDPDAVAHPRWSDPNVAAAGLHTSVADLSKLVSVLAMDGSYGNHAILSPASVAAMRTLAPTHDPDHAGQGLVLHARDFEGRSMFGVQGHALGSEAYFYFDPRDASGFVFMANANVRGGDGVTPAPAAEAAMQSIERRLLRASAAP